MTELLKELRSIQEKLESIAQALDNDVVLAPLKALEECANGVAKAWGHSWLGYQSRVYYEDLVPPPPGAHFSIEYGFIELTTLGTRGKWREFRDGEVESVIRKRAGVFDLSYVRDASGKVLEGFCNLRDDVVSVLRVADGNQDDPLLKELLEETEEIAVITESDFIQAMKPKGGIVSRDAIAGGQGLWAPPHLTVIAELKALKAPLVACKQLANVVGRASSHLVRVEKNRKKADRTGKNVCFCHGRSKEWKDLKDFIQDRKRLPWDEFSKVPGAGISNTERLNQMLEAAAIAFLVLTAEDEMKSGKIQARMNVIHEVGLFQGRLGFTKAIVLLEEGCEEFSNIEGLGQLRFPKNNIKAAFHDVELILEREGLIERTK